MSKLEDSIDNLFAPESISQETAQKLLDLVLKNYGTAEIRTYRRFTTIIVLWIIGFGIARGMLAEASFLGVKVNGLTILLLAFPFVTATAYYGTMASFSAAASSLFAVRRLLGHHWKKVVDNNLDSLVIPQTFLSVEITTYGYSTGWTSKLHGFWILLMSATLLLVPIACIAHMSYLAYTIAPVPRWLVITVIVMTVLIVIRAFSLVVQMSNYSA